MGVSKVIYGNTPVMDITDSTVTPQNLLSGEIAYGANGNRIVGTAQQNIADGIYAVEDVLFNTETSLSDTTYTLDDSINDYNYIRIVIGMNSENCNFIFTPSQLHDITNECVIYNDQGYCTLVANTDGDELTFSLTSFGKNRTLRAVYGTKLVDPEVSGHTILDNSGTALPAEPNLQLKGVYTHDDSTNETTVAEVTRVMTSADYNLLSEEEKQGVIVITDENPDPVYTDVIGTLTAGQTTITLGNTAITPTSTTEVFTDTPDVDYNTKELIYTPSVLEYTVHFTTSSSMIIVTLKDAEGTQISQDAIKYFTVNGESNAYVLDGLIKLWYDQPTWKIRTLRICTCDNVDYNIDDIVKSWDYADSVNFDVAYNELSWAIRLTYDARQTNLGVKVRVS